MRALAAAAVLSFAWCRAAAEPPPTLVEPFTSVGCASCPPADALLARLSADADGPVAGLGARLGQEASASVAAASGRGTAAVSWLLVLEPLSDRLRLGAGARLMGFGGFEPIAFSTGDPALIARGQTTSLAVPDARVLSLNLEVQAVLRLVGPLEAGANIDLAGLSFGPRRTGDHRTGDPTFAGPQRARVSSPNLLLIGSRDRGQLDSEFFLGWRVTEALTLRAGLSHVATEYRTLDPVDAGNRRFRRFTNQPFLGVAWRLR